MPGGVTYVSRGLLKTSPVDVTTPTLILFALPSNPMATRGRDDVGEAIEDARAQSPSLRVETRLRVDDEGERVKSSVIDARSNAKGS